MKKQNEPTSKNWYESKILHLEEENLRLRQQILKNVEKHISDMMELMNIATKR